MRIGFSTANIHSGKIPNYMSKIDTRPSVLSFRGQDDFVSSSLIPFSKARVLFEEQYTGDIANLKKEAQGALSEVVEETQKEFEAHDALKKVQQYQQARSQLPKNDSGRRLLTLLDDIYTFGYGDFCTTNELDPWENGVCLVSRDKELARGIFSAAQADARAKAFLDYEAGDRRLEDTPFRLRFKNVAHRDDVIEAQKAFSSALADNHRLYDETGAKTMMYVEDMEMLSSPKTDTPAGIAMMKDFFQKADRSYNTQIHCTISDTKEVDCAITGCNRMTYMYFIDKLDLSKDDIAHLEESQGEVKTIFDSISEGFQARYARCHKLNMQIQQLEEELETGLDKLKLLYSNPKDNKSAIVQFLQKHNIEALEAIKNDAPEVIEDVFVYTRKIAKNTPKAPLIAIGALFASSLALIAGGVILSLKDKNS